MKVSLDAYQAWRRRQESDLGLADAPDASPDERLLQFVWQHQRLQTEGLRTVDGRPLQVLHPGFWNPGAGPDFHQAVVRIGSGDWIEGAIEVDRTVAGWKAHGHHRNPDFRGVILQVVWHTPRVAPSERPVLALEPVLDSPVRDLLAGFQGEILPLPAQFAGACQAPLSGRSEGDVQALLRTAALVRFRWKARQLGARARRVGWRMALWEGLLVGLGYRHNAWPFRRLAEWTPGLIPGFAETGRSTCALPETEARLFGLAGFLPADLRSAREPYVAERWRIWWRLRGAYAEAVFPDRIWRMRGMRPSNHPHRRLALVAQWLHRDDFFLRLEHWFSDSDPARTLGELQPLLTFPTPEFWTTHSHFRSVSGIPSRFLLGRKRLIDLAVNTLLPWFWSRAEVGGNGAFQERAEKLFLALPASDSNRLLRDGLQRLWGRGDGKLLSCAADQQGLLQVLRDFCAHTNAACQDCRFPEFVQSLGS